MQKPAGAETNEMGCTLASMESAGEKQVFVFESENGLHWKETHKHRPFYQMPRGDMFWFILGHLLLLPLALLVLIATFLCLPLYYVWGKLKFQRAAQKVFHPEAQHILDTPGVNDAFIFGARDEARPYVSVVIPFYNREELVDWAVGSVLRSAVPMTMEVEIIAVDNGSTDNTVEQLKRHPIRIVHCAERGPGAARNAGIAASRGEIVVFTDSDCLCESDWLMRLVRPFVDPKMLITGGNIFSLFQDDFVATFTDKIGILNNRRFFAGSAYFPRFFATANAAYRRSALNTVGGFDNNLWMSEDADLAWRVLELGGKMAYVDNAVIYHQHRNTLRGLFSQAIDYGSASVAIFAKHRSRLEATAALSWRNVREIAWSPFALIVDPFVAKDAFGKKQEFFYLLWRLGFTIGTIRECIRRKVFFV